MHRVSGRRIGIDDETLSAIADYARSDRFSRAQRAALAIAVSLTREPRGLPPNLVSDLRAHYDASEIDALIREIARVNAANRIENARASLGSDRMIQPALNSGC